jgi:hypothetical protein
MTRNHAQPLQLVMWTDAQPWLVISSEAQRRLVISTEAQRSGEISITDEIQMLKGGKPLVE